MKLNGTVFEMRPADETPAVVVEHEFYFRGLLVPFDVPATGESAAIVLDGPPVLVHQAYAKLLVRGDEDYMVKKFAGEFEFDGEGVVWTTRSSGIEAGQHTLPVHTAIVWPGRKRVNPPGWYL